MLTEIIMRCVFNWAIFKNKNIIKRFTLLLKQVTLKRTSVVQRPTFRPQEVIVRGVGSSLQWGPERRRCKDRGAVGTEGVDCGEEDWSGEENFWNFHLKMVSYISS